MSRSVWRLLLALAMFAGLFVTPPGPAPTAHAGSTSVVISAFRTRGAVGGSDEFIELFNLSSTTVDIGGWKISGSNNAGTTSVRVTITTGTVLQPGQYFLATNSSTSGGPYSGPTTGNQTYGTGITDDGGIALLNASDAIIDQVGMSAGSAYKEGTILTPTTINADREYRRTDRCADTDNNANDFSLSTAPPPIVPKNLATTAAPCAGGDTAPTVSSTSPSANAQNVPVASNITVAFSEAVNVTASAFTLECPVSTAIPFALSPSPPGGVASFTLNPNNDLPSGTACRLTVVADQVSDLDGAPTAMAPPNATFNFTTASTGPATTIRSIQGAQHQSPVVGTTVTNVSGIVTAKRTDGSGNNNNTGVYLQDPASDGNDTTSEAIFVRTTAGLPSVNVGDAVTIATGTVREFRPGCTNQSSWADTCQPSSSAHDNLTLTWLVVDNNAGISVSSTGNTPPPAVAIGTERTPPSQVIDDDALATFDPANDGIDFWESLESMQVQVNNAVVVGPTNDFGETWVLANNGAGAGTRTTRGGIVVRSGDFNPERIQIEDDLASPGASKAHVKDRFGDPIVGVLSYNFGNFELLPTTIPTPVSGGLQREVTALAPDGERMTIASFNVENLDPSDPPSKFTALAQVIVNNLRSPDILGLEEIQDNNGPTNDSTVAADQTYALLINAIVAAGGPQYQFRQVDPIDDAEGGEPGGNIRVGFLFNPARVETEDRAGPGSVPTGTTTVVSPGGSGKPQLDSNPGRLQDPDITKAVYEGGAPNAFQSSRRPLVAEFTFRGRRLFVVNNHFSSKGGDDPLYGRVQPPVLASENQRREQARIVREFVTDILKIDPTANVVVLGDLNDFHFSRPLSILENLENAQPAVPPLHNLLESLPEGERYTYVFDGNSQSLDGGILVSNNLYQNAAFEYDLVHVNAEFHDQISDHEPQVVRFLIPNPGQERRAGP